MKIIKCFKNLRRKNNNSIKKSDFDFKYKNDAIENFSDFFIYKK